MTPTEEDAVNTNELTRSVSRDAEMSLSSTNTQTRFSFYNAEDYSTTKDEPNPNRFNFYSEELQKQVAELPTTSIEASPILTSENDPGNKGDSIEILRSLQQHEQQRLTILNNSVEASAALSNDIPNPYEDAIKEALTLLRKHRSPENSNSSAEDNVPVLISTSSRSRPTTIDTCQGRQSGNDEDLFQTVLPTSSLSSASHFERGFSSSTPSDVVTSGSTLALGDSYQAEIETRRRQRQERMAKYATRLAELKQENTTARQSPTHNDIDVENKSTESSAMSSTLNLELATSHLKAENQSPGLLPLSSSLDLELPIPDMLLQHSSQPVVVFPTEHIPHVNSGLTSTSKPDDIQQQQIQLGVERVLMAILERANSRGRGQQQQQLQSNPNAAHQEDTSMRTEKIEPNISLEEEEEDPLLQVMSELLRKPSSNLANDVPSVGREDFEKDFGLDNTSPREAMPIPMETAPMVGISESLGTFSPNLRMSHSDPGPEAHAELDRMVEEVLKKSTESITNGGSLKDLYTSDPINERVIKALSVDSNSDVKANRFQKETDICLGSEEESDFYDSGEEVDLIENDLHDENEEEDLYDDEEEDVSSQRDNRNPNILNGVLGPLSILAGGTTGVVLESDSSDAPSLFDSISAVARNFVAGVSSSSDSETIPSDAKISLSRRKGRTQAYELMLTLFAHLILDEFPKANNKLSDRIPSWDEANPDELGYRVVRLTTEQLEQIEKEFEHEMQSRRKEKPYEDQSFEDDLKEAQEQLKQDERRQKANGDSNESLSSNVLPKENKELACLENFPGIKPAGRGEMGDLEFFCLPIIFKSHVTGFEPTKDIYLEAGNIVAGQYLVEGEMGSAAFSTAYRCIDLNSEGDGPDGHEEVCLKVIKNTKDFFDQSLDEIKILELLRQTGMCDEKNILKMKAFFYHREHLIIVTELLRQNLFEFGKFILDNDEEPYFTISRLSYITRQCLVALDFVHKIGLVHSDIKPENILLSSYSRAKIKVIDFGSSCYLTDRQSSYIQSRSYRAPEVVLGLPYDGRIDMWSLGCVVAEMYTGEVTFQNDSVVSMLSRIEAICGPVPKRMIRQGRQSGSFYTSSGLLYEKVKKSRKNSEDSYSGDEKSSEGSDSENNEHVDILQPKKTSLAARLGFDTNLMEKYDADKHLSREQKKQAIFVDFVRSLLTIDPDKRPTAEQALQHPWMKYASTLTEADIKYP